MNPLRGFVTAAITIPAYGEAIRREESFSSFEPVGEAEIVTVPLTFKNVLRRVLGMGPTAEQIAAHEAAKAEPVADKPAPAIDHDNHAKYVLGCDPCNERFDAEFRRTYKFPDRDDKPEPERKPASPKPAKRSTTDKPKAKRNTDAWQKAIAEGRERRKREKELAGQ